MNPESDLGKFLAANPSVTMEAEAEVERHHASKHRGYRPSVRPHASCFGCPLTPCPLRFYIAPVDGCVFRRITEARGR